MTLLPHEKRELTRLGRVVAGVLTQLRLVRDKTNTRLDALEQAILETDTALREARAELEELRDLSPFASNVRRASQSADPDRRLHA